MESASARSVIHPALDDLLDRHVRAGHWPGGVYAVGPPGEAPRYMGAVGWRALEPQSEPADAGTLYDLASLTKPLFTALAALRLAQSGLIDPDRPLDDALPELAGYAGRTPSLDLLLSHASGLPAWAALYRRARDPQSAVATLAEIQPARRAATTAEYSCLGAIAAGIALQRLSGRSAGELIRDEVCSPLGIDADHLRFGPVAAGRAAPTERGRRREAELAGPGERGFEIVPGTESVLRGEVHDGNAGFLGGAAGNAGLFGTAAAVFAALSASAGAAGAGYLDESLRDRLTRPCTRSEDDVRTFGFQHAEARSAPVPRSGAEAVRDGWGHVGFTGTSGWVFPEHGAVIVLLTNRVHPVWREAPVQAWRREFHAAALKLLAEEKA